LSEKDDKDKKDENQKEPLKPENQGNDETRGKQPGLTIQQGDTTFNVNNYNSSEGRIKRLSVDQHFTPYDLEKLHRLRKDLFFEPEIIDPLTHALEQRSILFLSGDPGLGKTSIALLACALLCSRNRNPLDKVLLCSNLDRDLRVDLHEFTGEGEKYKNKVFILKHGFATRNEDLLRFSSALTRDGINYWSDRLRNNNAFLIITEDRSSIPAANDRLRSLGVLHELAPPTSEYLLNGLRYLVERRVAESEEFADCIRPEQIQEMIAEAGDLIAEELKGMARIASLVAEYLPQVLRQEISLSQALLRLKDLGPWLLQELAEHPAAWCTATSLALCSASRRPGGVPWLQFEAVRRALLHLVSREQGQRRPTRSLQEICCGGDVLRRARAEIVRESFPVRIQFHERHYPDQLWAVLLDAGRDLIATILPLLQSLAEGDDVYPAQAAARALGRIGQIDPLYITDPLIHRWSVADRATGRRKSFRDRGALLGSLFQGILGTCEDEDYQRSCLQLLQWLLRGDNVEALQAAVVSLSDIATTDQRGFQFAMSALRDIAERRLPPQLDKLRKLADRMREDEETLRLLEEIFEVRGTVEEIPRLTKKLFSRFIVAQDAFPVLYAFDCTLTRLFFSSRERRAVLERLVEWLQEDQEKLGPLVTYLFLKPEGISSLLEQLATVPQPGDNREMEGSLFLETVHNNSEAIAALSRFLEQLYIHLRIFPGVLRVLLEESYLSLLASCAREGKAVPRLRPTVVELLARLLESRDEEMNERILRLAQEHPASPDHADLRQLATEAVTRPARP
jgi:hypothetical protein